MPTMNDACVCYLPSVPSHCRRCHTTFADRDEALSHLSERQCRIAECRKCGTPWWLSNSPGAPVPNAGTWCVCIGCGEASIFTGRGLEVRDPSPQEDERIAQDDFILQYRQDRELTRRNG
jgi:hypothetical protein